MEDEIEDKIEDVVRKAMIDTLKLTLQIVAEFEEKHQTLDAQGACVKISNKIRSEISDLNAT